MPVVGEPIGANRFGLWVPVRLGLTHELFGTNPRKSPKWAQIATIRTVDPIVLVIVLVVVMPVAVLWALTKAASLRGPAFRPQAGKPVEALVTDVVPEEHPDEDDLEDDDPAFTIDSARPDPRGGRQGASGQPD